MFPSTLKDAPYLEDFQYLLDTVGPPLGALRKISAEISAKSAEHAELNRTIRRLKKHPALKHQVPTLREERAKLDREMETLSREWKNLKYDFGDLIHGKQEFGDYLIATLEVDFTKDPVHREDIYRRYRLARDHENWELDMINMHPRDNVRVQGHELFVNGVPRPSSFPDGDDQSDDDVGM